VSFLDDLVRTELADVRPYLPTPGDFRLRLDANEAPALFPTSVRERLQRAFGELALERYPDATAANLRRAIATRLGVDPDTLLLGVGSDEILALLVTALVKPRRGTEAPIVLTTSPTFVMYKMSARLRGLRVIEVPLDAGWDLAEESMLRALEVGPPHVVFIASPNNPTGTLMDRARLERVIEAAPRSLVVVDEAYIDYADRNQLDLFQKYENVAVLRTLSKVGFASLRIGWLVGRPELVRELDKVRLPYNSSGVAQALGALVVGELWDDVLRVVETVKSERARLAEALARLPGLEVSPSQANFLWLRTPGPAEGLFRALSERGILVRSFHASGGRLSQPLRITDGSPAENDELVRVLRELA
jgi:histidinol-phosphate aminotransferase